MELMRDVMQAMGGKFDLQQAQQRFEQLCAHPLVRAVLEEHPEVTKDVLHASQNLLYQFVKEQTHCRECPGLDACPNSVQGHTTRLRIGRMGENAYLYDEKFACMKFNTARDQAQLKSRIKSYYVDHSALHESLTFDDLLSANPGRAEAVGQVVEYLRKVESNGLPAYGLFLTGSFGRGKTFLMCYVLRELAKMGYTGAIVHMPQFVEEVKSMITDPGALRDWVESLKETDFLIFDDIGSENLTPWVRDHVLGAILTSRMNRKPTGYTANYSLEDLGKLLSFTAKEGEDLIKGQRLMERIRNYVKVVDVKGANMREKSAKAMLNE